MKLTFTVDTDEMYGSEDGEMYLVKDFNELLTDGLRKSIIAESKDKVASEKFKEFSSLVSDSIVSEIKVRMKNFLDEEIALTEKWGKTKFVGSIEDLIKMRFDDILLRPVDSDGKTINGCTSSGDTWIEWQIKNKLQKNFDRVIEIASDNILKSVKAYIDKKIVEIKDNAIKEQVDSAFVSILKGSK